MRLYLGGVGGLGAVPAAVYTIGQAGAELGWSVGTAGDVDADGLDDVIVGARRHDGGEIDEGAAFVFAFGSATPVWSVESNQAGGRLGWSVRTAGDVDADGYAGFLDGTIDKMMGTEA